MLKGSGIVERRKVKRLVEELERTFYKVHVAGEQYRESAAIVEYGLYYAQVSTRRYAVIYTPEPPVRVMLVVPPVRGGGWIKRLVKQVAVELERLCELDRRRDRNEALGRSRLRRMRVSVLSFPLDVVGRRYVPEA